MSTKSVNLAKSLQTNLK